MVTTGAIRHAKLQSNCHCQQTNIQFFYRPDALHVTKPCQSAEGKFSTTLTVILSLCHAVFALTMEIDATRLRGCLEAD